MNFRALTASLLPLAFCLSPSAQASNIADCEIVLLEFIADETGRGGANVASYRPAYDFMESVYNDEVETLYEIDGLNIQAVMCKRSDVIPIKSDFKIMATGIPFFLSQNFEIQDSDLITYYFKEGEFRYDYKGSGLDEETQARLTEQIAAFNAKDHGLHEKEALKKEAQEKEAKAKEKEKQDSEKLETDVEKEEEKAPETTLSEPDPKTETSESETLDTDTSVAENPETETETETETEKPVAETSNIETSETEAAAEEGSVEPDSADAAEDETLATKDKGETVNAANSEATTGNTSEETSDAKETSDLNMPDATNETKNPSPSVSDIPALDNSVGFSRPLVEPQKADQSSTVKPSTKESQEALEDKSESE